MLNQLLPFAESRGNCRALRRELLPEWRCRNIARKGIEIRTAKTDIATRAATLAHEIAHSLLHWTEDGHKITTREGKEIDKRQRELEAEATAYVVRNYFGIQSPSQFYLAAQVLPMSGMRYSPFPDQPGVRL